MPVRLNRAEYLYGCHFCTARQRQRCGTRGLYSDFVLPSRWKLSGRWRCRLLVSHACTVVEYDIPRLPVLGGSFAMAQWSTSYGVVRQQGTVSEHAIFTPTEQHMPAAYCTKTMYSQQHTSRSDHAQINENTHLFPYRQHLITEMQTTLRIVSSPQTCIGC